MTSYSKKQRCSENFGYSAFYFRIICIDKLKSNCSVQLKRYFKFIYLKTIKIS